MEDNFLGFSFRYIDDIFFTSNTSMKELNLLLKDINGQHPDIKLTSNVDNPISFLDVQAKNMGNYFLTSVYHKDAAEPYVVPFRSDHPRHVFVNIIECALLRAIRYSSTVEEFNRERRALKLKLLYNGYVQLFILLNLCIILLTSSYPTRYIYTQFHEFFVKHLVATTSILPMIHDANEYVLLRQRLLNQPSIDENKRAAHLAKQYNLQEFEFGIDPLIKQQILKRREKEKSIFMHYTHEKRFSHYKRATHALWTQTFRETTVDGTRIIVGTRNNPNLCQELVGRSPHSRQNEKPMAPNTS